MIVETGYYCVLQVRGGLGKVAMMKLGPNNANKLLLLSHIDQV